LQKQNKHLNNNIKEVFFFSIIITMTILNLLSKNFKKFSFYFLQNVYFF